MSERAGKTSAMGIDRRSRPLDSFADGQVRTLLDAVPEAVTVVDAAGTMALVNRHLADLCGYAVDELEGRYVEVLVPDTDRASHRRDRASFATAPVARPMGTRTNVLCRRKDGSTFPADISLAPLRVGAAMYVVATVHDESERHETEQQLSWKATHDRMTGLPNRWLLLDRLDVALSRRRNGRLGVMFVDLDGLKTVNDMYGHSAGDIVLVEAARRIVEVVRPADTVARFGGDEFVVLCDDVKGTENLAVVAERIVGSLAQPFDVGQPMVLGGSVGVATVESQQVEPEALIAAADAAMYEAKRAGGGTWRWVENRLRSRSH